MFARFYNHTGGSRLHTHPKNFIQADLNQLLGSLTEKNVNVQLLYWTVDIKIPTILTKIKQFV